MMKLVPPKDFLLAKRKPELKLRIEIETKGTHFFGEPSSLKRESVLCRKKKKPYILTVTDTSVALCPKRPGTPRPTPSPTSGRIATSFECGEFWRYFQNTSQLALVVFGGGDAVIGRTEARQLLANFRGTNVESIVKTDSGLLHICGLSVRQLHTFVSSLWSLGAAGMSVIKDLSIGSTKGSAKAVLLKSQKKRIDEHIRSHSVSVHCGVHERDDFLELGFDGATREELSSPLLSPTFTPLLSPTFTPLSSTGCTPIGHLHRFSAVSFSRLGDLDAGFEDEVKMDRPPLRVMKSIDLEFCKAEKVRKSRGLLTVDSARSSFSTVKGHSAMASFCSSLTNWALEEDVEDDVLSLGSVQLDDDEYDTDTSLEFSSDEIKSECESPARQWPESETGCHLRLDSEEIISLSVSVGERLATIMHAPVGV